MNHLLDSSSIEPLRRIAMLGTHLPRLCGIATFSHHLSSAIAEERPDVDCFVVAMNDPGRVHAYPERVRFEIAETDVGSYRRAADYLNVNPTDVLSIQHEYGIFGGKAGSHLLALMRELRMPAVTTLHTILSEPGPVHKAVMDEVLSLSARVVVMSERGRALLEEVHGVPHDKIDLVPHGIPVVPEASRSKDRLGVEGKQVVLTFGLLSPDKGIENVIEALPHIVERFPDIVYVVLGATHPHVKARHGETYRLMLESRAKQLGVDGNMIFHDRFVSEAELAEFLSAADIYVTPYLKPEQITSGTLAYAVGSGRAVISTPYHYAQELLAHDRGVLVPWRDPAAIARAVVELLSNDVERERMRERAAKYGRHMQWPAVARSYVRTFERARVEHAGRLRASFQAKTLRRRPAELPSPDLSHLRAMTDDTGLIQHAAYNVPRYEDGYCVDDNARAMLLVAHLEEAGTEDERLVRSLGDRYLAFVRYAFDGTNGRFRNFMTFDRRWVDEVGSDDSHARTVWALGTVVGRSPEGARRRLAGDLFHAALPAVTPMTSPRAWAYTLLGIDEYLKAFQGETSVEALRDALAGRLLAMYLSVATEEWPWFESSATYCNARLSQALLVSGARVGRPDMTAAGLRSLAWLARVQRSDQGHFSPIGTNGFFRSGGAMALFDQQPVEACTMVSACLDARRVTGDELWGRHASRAMGWFFGENRLHASLFDPSTGGCRDGLHADRPNENQGAESTLSFLLALAEMRAADRVELARGRSAPPPPHGAAIADGQWSTP
jgi:glycosyltransferase involved in cell wall biosynthesis